MSHSFKKGLLKSILFVLSLVLQGAVIYSVIDRTVNIFTLILFFVSIIALYISLPYYSPNKPPEAKKDKELNRTRAYAFIVIAAAIAVRIALMMDTKSFHIDEYLTAHFSYSLPEFSEIDWFGVYPPVGVWICQFPLFYFFVQKIFFNLFGVSTIAMRLSTLPYLLIIFVFLYLTIERLYGKKAGVVSLLILSLLSPDLYITKWSLHFISSTAFFVLSIYLFVRALQDRKKIFFGLTGVAIALCYQTYYSSYVAFPLFILFSMTLFIKQPIPWHNLKNLCITLLVFIFCILPLATYAKYVDNFLTQRTDQVKVVNGTWSQYKDVEVIPQTIIAILGKQATASFNALYKDNVGGVGGYWFGRIGLFDKFTFTSLLVGLIYFIYTGIAKKDGSRLFFAASIAVTFIGGMVLTTPPPAVHRISLIFPIAALIIGVTVSELSSHLPNKLRYIVLTAITGLLLLSNIHHFSRVRQVDGPDDPDFYMIEKQLNSERADFLYIAGFDSYALGKVLYIRSSQHTNSITHPLPELLPKLPKDKPSFIVLLYPDEDKIDMLKSEFPKAELVGKYERHQLFKTTDGTF